MHRAALFATLFLALPAWAGDYANCILDKAPGVANEAAAAAVHQVCLEENPGGLQAVAQGSGRGLFGLKSGAECTAKKASDTRSMRAGALISASCRCLYNKANLEGSRCGSDFDPSSAQPAS